MTADIRTLPAYHLCRLYLERLIDNTERPTTKSLRVGVESVVHMLRASFSGRGSARRLPTIATALADPQLGKAMIAALCDLGFEVAQAPQLWCEGTHLACNVRGAVLWEYVPYRQCPPVRH